MLTKRIQHMIGVARLPAVLVALAVAVPLTSVAAAGSDATKQRVAITSRGVSTASGAYKFVLTPLQRGALKRDSGTASSVLSKRVIIRKGQRVEISPGVETYKGKRGSLTVRFRIEWVEAGNGYHPGTGTWKVVRGTGQYARIAGGGRSGNVWLDRGQGPWSTRLEGFLTLP